VTWIEQVARLVNISSVSRHEHEIAEYIEHQLAACSHLEVVRVGDNVVARTKGTRSQRVILAGHLDTVPGNSAYHVLSKESLTGLGAVDMKASLAVMLSLALDATPRAMEMTFVFYAREEVARSESGLEEIFQLRPDLMSGDVAIVGEPTGGHVEAGCQGSMRVQIEMSGLRAHSARPFEGVNAIHRAGSLIERAAGYQPREVVLDGVVFVEQLQVVGVHGGVAPNVVPDNVQLVLNYRVAPDRDFNGAVTWLQSFLAECLGGEDSFAVVDWAPPAQPQLQGVLGNLVTLTQRPARAKVGWTDVATFAAHGIPATNFGAGDPLLAHTDKEKVFENEVADYHKILVAWLG
jgi:succinyl-diaminopimelate desuccinylase